MTERDIELTRRKILGAAGAVGTAGAAAGLGTSALFSDEESFTNNSITAGTLDLKVSWDEHYFNGIVNLDDVPDSDVEFGGPDSGETGFPSSNESPYLAVADGAVDTFMADTRRERFPEGGLGPDEDPCTELADVPGVEIPPPLIDLDDVKPGDFGEVTFDFSLCDNPGYLWMTGGLVDENENGVNGPEGDSPGEDFGSASLWPLAALAAIPALGGDDGEDGDGDGGVEAAEPQAEAVTGDRRSTLRKGAAAAGMGAAGLSAVSGAASADSNKGDSQPTDPDGPNDVLISNGILEVTVGELGSGTNVQGLDSDWNYDDGSLSAGTLYRETYGFRDGTGPHVDAENNGTLVSGYPSMVSAGTTAESTVEIPVLTDIRDLVTIEVDRDVTLDPNIATLRVEYAARNPSGSGATFSDLRLSQYVDYDIGDNFGDVGEYFLDTQTDCEFIFQENTQGLFAGFTAEDLSVNHDLRDFFGTDGGQDNFQSSNIDFNNDDKYPDSGSSDVTLTFEWSLGQLAPGESASLQTAFVYNPTQEDFEDQLCAESPGTPAPTTPSPGEAELVDAVQARAWYDGGGGDGPSGDVGDDINQDDEQVFLEGTLREVLSELSSGSGVPLDGDESVATDFDETSDPSDDSARDCYTAADDVHYIGFEWWVPRDVGNEIQSDSVTFDLGFYAEQCRNNDGIADNQ